MAETSPIGRYRSNLRGEADSAVLYRTLAESEGNPERQAVYRRLAAVEEAHAEFWRRRLAALGAATAARPGWRTRALAWAALRFGADRVLPLIGAAEHADFARYDAAMFAIGAATTQFTGRGVLFSGLRQLMIGVAAAAATYGVGKLIGVSLAG